MKSIKWNLESGCNLNCKHCIVGKINYKDRIPLHRHFDIVDKLVELGYQHIVFSTKEPLINKDIFEILGYCTNNNIYVSIITNGMILDEDTINKINTFKIRDLAISLEGWNHKTNDYVRGLGNFESVTSVLNYLNYMGNREFNVVIQLNITSFNCNDCSGFIDYFSNYKDFIITVGNLIPLGNCKDNSYLCCNMKEYFLFVKNLFCTNANLNLKSVVLFEGLNYFSNLLLNVFEKLNQEPSIPKCSLQSGSFSLMNNGDICRCILLENQECKIKFKNMFDSVLDYYNSKYDFNNKIQSDYKTKGCNSCIIKEQCNICYLYTSTENICDYLNWCHYFKDINENVINSILNNEIKICINKNIEFVQLGNENICVSRNYNVSHKTLKKQNIAKLLLKMSKYNEFFYKDMNITKDELREIYYEDLITVKEVDINVFLPIN